MSTYDVDAYLASLEKPTIHIGGKTYTGKLLSVQEAARFEQRRIELSKKEDNELWMAFLKDYFYTIFPKPSIPWQPDVVKDILRAPNVFEIYARFFTVTWQAINPPASHEMNGTK